ncbi:MFS transporter [Cryptosporangium arvum]|uniref:Arabinose efflux permease family protein n=1 Tax=Cryptosporangium arvum DSM 44712 TaxID=927661 RepID=A0A010ZTE5_9ACTN|nr:MFS transporter [Cryptosporangium arvum]EXG80497.1 arabinose efflux permease family protein [Cryptosporangium arvum DSM 44712]
MDWPGFGGFFVARTVSWAGSALTLVALPVLLYERTGNAALTGLATALEALPYLLLGLPAGALADRWDRRRTLVVTALLSGLLLASVPVADAWGALTPAHVLVVAGGVATLFVFSDAATFGVLPTLVGRDRIAGATGRLNTANTIVTVAGPAVGGLSMAVLGPAWTLGLDAASFAVAAVLLHRLVLPPVTVPEGPRRMRAEIAEGLRFLWNHQAIRWLTLLGVGNSLTGGAVLGLVVVAAVRNLDLGESDGRIGLLYAAAGAGSLLAGMLLPPIRGRLTVGRITLAGLLAGWVAVSAWALSTGLVGGLVALAAWQAAHVLVNLNGIVLRQESTPDALQGRVNTTARMIAWGGQPLGAALGGVLAEVFDVRAALLIAGAGVATSALVGAGGRLWRLDVRTPRPEPVVRP